MGVTFAPLCKREVSWRARGSERRAPALFPSPAVARISVFRDLENPEAACCMSFNPLYVALGFPLNKIQRGGEVRQVFAAFQWVWDVTTVTLRDEDYKEMLIAEGLSLSCIHFWAVLL